MQNDPNNRPYYYTPPRVAGRLIGQKPSNVGLWTSFKQQSSGIKIGIVSIAVLLVILVLLVPYVLFSGLFTTTSNNQAAVAQPNQNNAATVPTVTPTDVPTVVATDTPTPDSATSMPAAEPTLSALDKGTPSNPWGYDFNAGSFITAPPATFCSYFSCITGFWNGQGYIEECQDGTYTLAGGVAGDCDAHGGDLRPLYYHPSLAAPQPALPTAQPPTPAPKPTLTPIAKPTLTPVSKSRPTPTTVPATPTPKPH